MPEDCYVPVAELVEHNLPVVLPGFELRVEEQSVLGQAEGVTHQSKPIITLSERTYDGLYRDQARPRMTMAHELGHLLLHTGRCGYAFSRTYDPLIDVERQADIFAAAFLMPEFLFRRVHSIREAMRLFGVSRDAATCRARSFKLWKLISDDRPTSTSKKKGSSKRQTP